MRISNVAWKEIWEMHHSTLVNASEDYVGDGEVLFPFPQIFFFFFQKRNTSWRNVIDATYGVWQELSTNWARNSRWTKDGTDGDSNGFKIKKQIKSEIKSKYIN